jgi:hypothetical protein
MPAFLWGSTDELDSIAPASLGQLFVQPYRVVWIPDRRSREIMLMSTALLLAIQRRCAGL